MKILKLILVTVICIFINKCSVNVYFNTVVDGTEYEDDVELVLNNVKFVFEKMFIINFDRGPILGIEVTNESTDTVYYNPSKIKFFINDKYFYNKYGKDSIYTIFPKEECKIFFICEEPVFRYTRPGTEVKIELVIEDFKRGNNNIPFPTFRYVPENKKHFADYKFVIN
jgi:hypothetical protein